MSLPTLVKTTCMHTLGSRLLFKELLQFIFWISLLLTLPQVANHTKGTDWKKYFSRKIHRRLINTDKLLANEYQLFFPHWLSNSSCWRSVSCAAIDQVISKQRACPHLIKKVSLCYSGALCGSNLVVTHITAANRASEVN